MSAAAAARGTTVGGRRVVVGAILALAAASISVGALMGRMADVPPDLDLATARTTAAGAYRVAYEPSRSPVPINVLHAWTLSVADAGGAPVRGAQVAVSGDMPQHGHGLATAPETSGEVEPGRYLVEGMKFQMGGWWVVDVTVTADGVTDQVRFNLMLER